MRLEGTPAASIIANAPAAGNPPPARISRRLLVVGSTPPPPRAPGIPRLGDAPAAIEWAGGPLASGVGGLSDKPAAAGTSPRLDLILTHTANGNPIITPSQDIVMGCYYLTASRGEEGEKVEAGDGKTLMPARDIDTIGRIAMVADPQGNPFYVMKPTPPAGNENKVSDVFSPAEEQRVSWNELTTSDPTAARSFLVSLPANPSTLNTRSRSHSVRP